jgi:hypothetical protein
VDDERDFSPAEVEALIPRLADIMGATMAAHREVQALREEVGAEQRRIALAGGGVIDREAWQARQRRLDAAIERVKAGLAAITELGGATKDLALGLVDFPHRRDGRVVNLCWKHGETSIRFWHGLDEGYAARKPL